MAWLQVTFEGYGSCNQWIKFCPLGSRGSSSLEAWWECWGWCFSSQSPGSVPSRLDNLVVLFQQVGHCDESSLYFFVNVETGSGDCQPHKSVSSLVKTIASSSEWRYTGFSVPSFMFHVYVHQCIKIKSGFAMATSTKLNNCSAKLSSWCIGNRLTYCSRPRICAWSQMSSSRMLEDRQ